MVVVVCCETRRAVRSVRWANVDVWSGLGADADRLAWRVAVRQRRRRFISNSFLSSMQSVGGSLRRGMLATSYTLHDAD